MVELIKRHTALINSIDMQFKRNIIKELPWDERLIAIKGARGIGKTTMLLQYIKQTYQLKTEALYISLDDPYFYNNKLMDFADNFVAKGGKHLFIDEVHKYPSWAIEVKKIYDYNPDLKVVFTGSSLLEILNSKADLSRRALSYFMQGLSFREFLEFRYGIKIEVFTLQEIIDNHTEIALEISSNFKPLKYFSEYLRVGYFPFFNKSVELYNKRLFEIINMIIDFELPSLRSVEISRIPKVKQLLSVVSQSVPFKPNVSSLAKKINISRNSLLEYINSLVEANILTSLHKDSFGVSSLQKPEKLYLHNTNYMFALINEEPNIGNIRETFFLNQVMAKYEVTYPTKGDFLVENRYLFEVGGKNKTNKQIQGVDNSYVVADDIEFGTGNTIPLWLFGFMY